MRLNATDEKRVKPVSNELFTNCELRSTTSNHSSAKRWFCFAPIFWFHFAFRCNGMRSRIRMECFINDSSAHRNVNNFGRWRPTRISCKLSVRPEDVVDVLATTIVFSLCIWMENDFGRKFEFSIWLSQTGATTIWHHIARMTRWKCVRKLFCVRQLKAVCSLAIGRVFAWCPGRKIKTTRIHLMRCD